MLLRLFSFLLTLSLATLAQAERKLPANVQVDLLFPRNNETYAPTQRFPIVVGIQNLDAIWPVEMGLSLDVFNLDSSNPRRRGNQDTWLGISSFMFPNKIGPDAPRQFLYYPTINMTNGTTGSFEVRWDIHFVYRCFGNDSMEDGGYGWSNRPDGRSKHYIVFNTAPGGQSPDVAATLNACPEGGENTTATVRVTDMLQTWGYGYPCPVLATDVQPSRCAYRDVAQEVAANVSADIMRRIGCEEGTWQNITTPCVPKESGTVLSTGLQRGLASWILGLGLALVAWY